MPPESRAEYLGINLSEGCGLDIKTADRLAENMIGLYELPLCVAENIVLDGESIRAVPMVTEEPSVVAAICMAAKAAGGSMKVINDGGENILQGQIQIMNPRIKMLNEKSIQRIENAARDALSSHMKVLDVKYHTLACGKKKDMSKVEIKVNTGKAMGANAVNTMCETVAGVIEDETGGRALAKILTNALVESNNVIVGGYFEMVDNFLNVYEFARLDKNRCTTNNKGVMNGVMAVAQATGQDTRAIDAGVHAQQGPLVKWYQNDNKLYGEITLPLCIGVIGGLTSRHPTVKKCLEIVNCSNSPRRLACIMAAVGLCSNYAATKALATDGIQRGHMRLHGRRL